MTPIILFSQMLPAIAWIIIGSSILTAGDISFRYYIETHFNYGFVISFAIYSVGMFFMVLSFFDQNIAVATVMAILLNIVGYLISSYFLFGDTIGMRETAGLILGFAAIYLLEGIK